ncbi:MAG: YdcF family protein [Haliscomenobacter sp.]
MFFTASKLLYVLIQPIHWIFFLLALVVFHKRPRVKRLAGILALTLLLAGTNRGLLNLVCAWWETPPLAMDHIQTPYQTGILLGGYTNAAAWPRDGRIALNSSANRFVQALELYQQGKIQRILVSGGWGGLLGKPRMLEARNTREHLIRLGVPAEDILIETQSRNTWENAQFSARLLHKQPTPGRLLLITSAWHMPRALRCFRKAGLEPAAYPVDYIRHQSRSWWQDALTFQPDILQRWEALIKEWVGILAYTAKGYN